MKTLVFLCMLCSVTVAFSQDFIGKDWLINELIGGRDTQVDMYELALMPKGRSVGYYVYFKPNGTFFSSYFAPCGNDCFHSITGTYKKEGKHYLRLFAYKLSHSGDCEVEDKLLNKNLGTYYLYTSSKGTIHLTEEGLQKRKK